jgi:hypothetical protein
MEQVDQRILPEAMKMIKEKMFLHSKSKNIANIIEEEDKKNRFQMISRILKEKGYPMSEEPLLNTENNSIFQ